MADAIELLDADHRALQRLFAEYADLVRHGESASRRRALAERTCLALAIHNRLEEDLFHPALRQALRDEDIADDCEHQHEASNNLMAQIFAMRVDDPLQDARMAVLHDYFERHVRLERESVFKALRNAPVDLRALGRALEARKHELHTVADALRENAWASALP